MTHGNEKSFGVFVGLYNKLNGTTYSVKDALNSAAILSIYEAAAASLIHTHGESVLQSPVVTPRSLSTRKKSLGVLKMAAVDGDVLRYLRGYEGEVPLSRWDIAVRLDLRLSTVCGAVNRLKHAGLVVVAGVKTDPNSKRFVEVIEAREETTHASTYVQNW